MLGLPFEVDTSLLIDGSLENGKIVALPRIMSGNEMTFYRIKSIAELKCTNILGIKEPNDSVEYFVDKSNIDLMIIPGVCFDKNKNRLGYGKGYYDRYLKELDNVIKVGICFDEQLVKDEYISADEYDIKMDFVVTDKNELIK